MSVARRLAFVLMLLVSGWSFWAWAQPKATRVASQLAEQRSAERREHLGANDVAAEREGPEAVNWFEFGKESPPFIATIVNFGILVAGYYLLGKKPIAAALQNRRDSIAKEIEDAQKMRREAEARAKIYQAKLDQLEEETRTTREAFLRTGEAERDRIVAEAQAKAERMRKDAEFLVLQEVKQLRQDLWRDTLETAIAAAAELLQKGVSPADQERLAEDYLIDLGAKPMPERSAESVQPTRSGPGSPS
ncbi:MAG: ATP synthase F0 subunit B [Myxococcota bacterium]|nr:ATP synthase F0 subunit B [Myxococcota bacterium]